MENILLIAVLLLSVGGAARYIWREKRKGKKCIGCPYSDSCSAKSCASMCDCAEAEQE